MEKISIGIGSNCVSCLENKIERCKELKNNLWKCYREIDYECRPYYEVFKNWRCDEVLKIERESFETYIKRVEKFNK